MNNNNSVQKTFLILETLVKYPNGCSISIISKETHLHKSTVYRLLSTLIGMNYVVNTLEGNYRLTFKIVNIGQTLIYETNIIQLAIAPLTELRNETGETINLKLFQGDHGVLLFKLEPKSGNFRTRTYMGQSIPLYCSASGKVFLAYKGEAFIREYWEQNRDKIKKITDNTIVDLPALLDVVAKVKQNGYSTDYEETEWGISCIAAPVFNIHGNVDYSISIAMQTHKLKENKGKFLEPLLRVSAAMSQELGYYETKNKKKE